MLEIMMYLSLVIWWPNVTNQPHGQVDGQHIQEMAHTNNTASHGQANSHNPNR